MSILSIRAGLRVVAVVGAVMFCAQVMAEEVKIGAGAAFTENVLKKVKEPFEASGGVKVVIVDCGPVEALKQLDEGKVDAAAAGMAFGDWMALMEKSNAKVADPSAYKYRVVGKDIVKVLAHKDVGVKALSKEQLKGIFTGKVTNWKEVGGADLAIVVVYGTKIPGTQAVFQKQVMDGEAYLSKTTEAGTAAEVKEKIMGTAGAVGVGPVALVDEKVASPEIPEIGRPITMITKAAPSEGLKQLLTYIVGEGKKHVASGQ